LNESSFIEDFNNKKGAPPGLTPDLHHAMDATFDTFSLHRSTTDVDSDYTTEIPEGPARHVKAAEAAVSKLPKLPKLPKPLAAGSCSKLPKLPKLPKAEAAKLPKLPYAEAAKGVPWSRISTPLYWEDAATLGRTEQISQTSQARKGQ
jgi:hypothetical protein